LNNSPDKKITKLTTRTVNCPASLGDSGLKPREGAASVMGFVLPGGGLLQKMARQHDDFQLNH
jgi:hypothetical protein